MVLKSFKLSKELLSVGGIRGISKALFQDTGNIGIHFLKMKVCIRWILGSLWDQKTSKRILGKPPTP